jgi:hypothetical protein
VDALALAGRCPVCGFAGLCSAARGAGGRPSFEICPSCGFQSGVSDDDHGFSYADWRARWIEAGMRWNAGELLPEPDDYDPCEQLRELQRERSG